MDSDSVVAFLILITMGISSIALHLWSLSEKGRKSQFMADHIYAGRAYMGIPLGIAFVFFALATIPKDIDVGLFIVYIGGVFGLVGLIFAFTQPSFLKPTWLKWLEREHGDIMPILRKEVHKMGGNSWDKKMQTQADLEEWVLQTREKYRL
ncbi:MAG: hypothetical protein ACFFDT_12095 [Candidatus Hodarchaeota archaeon]